MAITESGTCKHANGLVPIHCWYPLNILLETHCADECASLKSCISYVFGTQDKKCLLIPSAGGCPTGWTKDGKTYAQNSNELKPTKLPDHVCWAKRLGMYCYIRNSPRIIKLENTHTSI